MAMRLFEKGREGLIDGTVDLDTNTIKAALMRLTTADVGVKAVTGATNATPIVLTATAHGFSNGDIIVVGGVGGNTAANNIWKASAVAANTITLVSVDDGTTNSVGNGAYTSGDVVLLAVERDDLGAELVEVEGEVAAEDAEADDEAFHGGKFLDRELRGGERGCSGEDDVGFGMAQHGGRAAADEGGEKCQHAHAPHQHAEGDEQFGGIAEAVGDVAAEARGADRAHGLEDEILRRQFRVQGAEHNREGDDEAQRHDEDGECAVREFARKAPAEGLDVRPTQQHASEREHGDGERGGLDAAGGGGRAAANEHEEHHQRGGGRQHGGDGRGVEAGGAGGDGVEQRGEPL